MLIDGKYELVTENETHWICKCPYCLERGLGKPDTKGKLSIHKNKGVGQCFRCGFVYYNKEAKLNLLNSENKSPKKYYEFDISSYPLISENSLEHLYLKNKRNLSDETIKVYCLKSILHHGNRGILIPNKYLKENIVDYFQIRFIEGNNRYYNLSHTDKPIQGILGLDNRRKLLICEGIFNCMSIRQSTTDFDSIALQGKKLTKYQEIQLLKILENNFYDEIVLALDHGCIGETIDLFEILKSITGLKQSVVVFKDSKDFNEMTVEEINQLLQTRIPISVDNIKIFRTLFSRKKK